MHLSKLPLLVLREEDHQPGPNGKILLKRQTIGISVHAQCSRPHQEEKKYEQHCQWQNLAKSATSLVSLWSSSVRNLKEHKINWYTPVQAGQLCRSRSWGGSPQSQALANKTRGIARIVYIKVSGSIFQYLRSHAFQVMLKWTLPVWQMKDQGSPRSRFLGSRQKVEATSKRLQIPKQEQSLAVYGYFRRWPVDVDTLMFGSFRLLPLLSIQT